MKVRSQILSEIDDRLEMTSSSSEHHDKQTDKSPGRSTEKKHGSPIPNHKFDKKK